MATQLKQCEGTERRSEILEQLLTRHGRTLRRQAARHSSRPADAEEALQDACLAFLRAYDGEGGDQAIAYLMVAVKRCAWAIGARAARRRESGFEDFSRVASGLACDLQAVLPDVGRSPMERALDVELAEERRRALGELKPDERTALLLFAFGYSYAEIAERCGWTHTKVNRCLAEGRAALRKSEQSG